MWRGPQASASNLFAQPGFWALSNQGRLFLGKGPGWLLTRPAPWTAPHAGPQVGFSGLMSGSDTAALLLTSLPPLLTLPRKAAPVHFPPFTTDSLLSASWSQEKNMERSEGGWLVLAWSSIYITHQQERKGVSRDPGPLLRSSNLDLAQRVLVGAGGHNRDL